ncbi:hypothetical protein [Naasia sp. SYSU D00948]|uniref:hypothetical protein n=1 Tax=Naasia sp. SYSU D00948 TaxID=2817379 RepID=UPI001B307DD8|nr:hypothetical protein [Naasia sp. SYSU D00948]
MRVPKPSEDTQRLFDELIESLGPDVKRAQMMGRPTLMTGRTMVACLNGDVLGIRLGRNTSVFAEALDVEGAAVFQPGPRHEFKDWVQIPASSSDAWLPFTVAALEAARR